VARLGQAAPATGWAEVNLLISSENAGVAEVSRGAGYVKPGGAFPRRRAERYGRSGR
jgi:hypothetical protein